ncbi:MAG: M23 family metallopeptidase [Rikenellaceae bacterium]
MKSERNIVYLMRNLREKLRVSVKDTRTDSEVWYSYFSVLGLVTRVLVIIIILSLTLTLALTYTSFIDLLPGYPGNRSREMLIENIMRLDSLENELNQMQIYSENVSLIMQGKQPIEINAKPSEDSLAKRTPMILPSSTDSLLRREIQDNGAYKLSSQNKGKVIIAQEFITPLRGKITQKFSPKDNTFGVKISATEDKQIMAIDAGTVILSTWSPSDGSIIQIQHANNIISVYKHAFTIIKKQGERLRAGEVIGFIGEEDEKSSLIFELWNMGNPVDPENYILF